MTDNYGIDFSRLLSEAPDGAAATQAYLDHLRGSSLRRPVEESTDEPQEVENDGQEERQEQPLAGIPQGFAERYITALVLDEGLGPVDAVDAFMDHLHEQDPMMYGPGVDFGHTCMRWYLKWTGGLPA